jgi:hypothetical protein
LASLALFCLLQISPLAYAATQSIAQDFHAQNNQKITTGALVSTTASDPGTVELASSASTKRLLGVVSAAPTITLTAKNAGTHVVISGTTNVLVSDINGPIATGDKITASPIAGVGMHATTDGQIVGTAQTALNTNTSQIREIKDSKGKIHTVHITSIPVQVGIAYYQAPGSDFLPPFVQRTVDSLAGRPVSLIRITVSGLLLLLGFISIVVFVYTATRSAMISLGRNPLAKQTILSGLYQAFAVAAVAGPITLFAAYVILVA